MSTFGAPTARARIAGVVRSTTQREALGQITAPHFCAGVVFVKRIATEAAPILNNRRFSLIGWDADRVLAHCKARGWEIHRVA